MAVQQLTQPIVNPIPAFDAITVNTIDFVVIGGAQVVGNRLVISNNETGEQIYNVKQLTMKLEHTLPAGTLFNGGYYNAVIYTVDNSGAESEASTAVPFYCYSNPVLTIDNIPSTETIENGTYAFVGNYAQQENELLDSYQFTLYDSNKNILSQSPLIYYESDSSLSYTFVGMSNDTAYYVSLTGETVNNTQVTSGLRYFTVRYLQPASFAICDLINDCEDGYIQISSNIVAIDGKSNPDPPIYIDDKEVDLTDPDTWVKWNEGFRIKDDFTLRAWGRNFSEYEPLITLTNNTNSDTVPNKIELKWMVAEVVEQLPNYVLVNGNNVNLLDSETDSIEKLSIGGNTSQSITTQNVPTPTTPMPIYNLGDIKNLVNINGFNIAYTQQYYQETNTGFELQSNFIYTLSFAYNINSTTTDIYYSIGYGTDSYTTDIKINIQYNSLTNGRNFVSFTAPDNIPEGSTLWVKFGQTIILADIDVDISNIQLEYGNKVTDYQLPTVYNIYPTVSSKNLYNYDAPMYIIEENAIYSTIQNGYNISPIIMGEEADIAIGFKNKLVPGNTYAISYSKMGNFSNFELYTVLKGSQERLSKIEVNDGIFVAPEGLYDLQLVFYVDSSVETNVLEIWNIQIEANDMITTYEPYQSTNTLVVLDEPLRGIGDHRDLICLESPNILNQATQTGDVSPNTTYYLSQKGDTVYYIWYYNTEGNLITFLDAQGKEASGVSGTKGTFTTHKECVKIVITKTASPTANDVTEEELLTNQVIISKGDNEQQYYPYISEPSIIRYIGTLTLTGEEEWKDNPNVETCDRYTLNISQIPDQSIYSTGFCEYFTVSNTLVDTLYYLIYNNGQQIDINFSAKGTSTLSEFRNWLMENNVTCTYIMNTPIITPLSESNISALEGLQTYKPVSNVFVDNNILGRMAFEYANAYTDQTTQNVYAILRCYNTNTMPYIVHSNYITIPSDTDKIFIWMRRKNNIFDLHIENLGDYNEGDKPVDITKPIVTLDIDTNIITQTTIPVTANSIDENGLTTIRFSKDNGVSWDEIITVDGLSSTNTYVFENLTPDTIYTIRVEAIDLAGNIGGISQQVTTKA